MNALTDQGVSPAVSRETIGSAGPALEPGAPMLVALRLTLLRTARGTGLRAEAAAAGVSAATLARAESGVKPVSVESLTRLARHYGVATDALVGLAPLPVESLKGIEG